MENKKPIEISLKQHTALADDEKGKYREVWQWSAKNSKWNDASVFDYENFQSYHTWIESDFIYLNPEYSTRQVFRLIEQPEEEKEVSVFANVVEILPKHFLTMINTNYKCIDCGNINHLSLSEEEDLCQTEYVIDKCKCSSNNRIKVSDMYPNI